MAERAYVEAGTLSTRVGEGEKEREEREKKTNSLPLDDPRE